LQKKNIISKVLKLYDEFEKKKGQKILLLCGIILKDGEKVQKVINRFYH
jgi:hypothetical protein